jgi:hypothetical protein
MNARFATNFEVGILEVVLIRFALPNWCGG